MGHNKDKERQMRRVEVVDNDYIKLFGGRYSELYFLPRKWNHSEYSFTLPCRTILDLMEVYPELNTNETAIQVYREQAREVKQAHLIKAGQKYVDPQQLEEAGLKNVGLIRNYQLMGITFGIMQGSIILAFDMGLGKGLVSLAISLLQKHLSGIKNVLIVCPNSIKYSVWEKEIKKWTDESYIIVTPQNRDADFSKYFYTVINYEMLLRLGDLPSKVADFDKYPINIYPIQPEFLILDEAHNIKNSRSKRTKLLHKFSEVPAVLASGTPVLNKVDEMWSLLHMMDSGYWNKYFDFVNRYCVVEDSAIWVKSKKADGSKGKPQKRKITKIIGSQNLDELKRRIEIWHVARSKEEVMSELPPLIKEERFIELTEDQESQYDAVVAEVLDGIEKGYDRTKAYNCLQQLLQLCDTFKYDDVLDILDGIDATKKTVIFSWFVNTANCVSSALQEKGYKVLCITGETPMAEREKYIAAFQGDPSYTILVATIATCSVGLDFSVANNCVFVSRSYTPAINDQAVSRLHRSGQVNSVTEVSLYCSDTVEERVHEILEQKKNLIDELFSKEKFIDLFKKKKEG
jgi:SNF2 family DNA or RNA helicase